MVFDLQRIRNCNVDLLVASNSEKKWITSLQSLTNDQFLNLCILGGCDYLDSLPKLGLRTAISFVVNALNTKQLIETLTTHPRHAPDNPESYIVDFYNARRGFLYHTVLDRESKKMVLLNPAPETVSIFPLDPSDYIAREGSQKTALPMVRTKETFAKTDSKSSGELSCSGVDEVNMKATVSLGNATDNGLLKLLTCQSSGNSSSNAIDISNSPVPPLKRRRGPMSTGTLHRNAALNSKGRQLTLFDCLSKRV